jgi:SAM-dependent methyltransferase
MKKILLAVLLVLIAAPGWQGTARADYWTGAIGQPPKDVPYVPTPQKTVEKMLALAEVSGEDLLYDLGCGDGRIVITAATRYGTRGIGVDIDPSLVRMSQENAGRANVSHLVQFIQADLFRIDFREASVVTLYLLQHINIQLRPKLLNDLRPGSRIVSHAFDMGEWQSDQMVNGKFNRIYLWVVPANASGVWKWDSTSAEGDAEHFTIEIIQRFQEVTGTASAKGSPMPIEFGKIVGDNIHFTMMSEAGSARFEGKVQGHIIEGTIESAGGRTAWRATRDPATMSPL